MSPLKQRKKSRPISIMIIRIKPFLIQPPKSKHMGKEAMEE